MKINYAKISIDQPHHWSRVRTCHRQQHPWVWRAYLGFCRWSFRPPQISAASSSSRSSRRGPAARCTRPLQNKKSDQLFMLQKGKKWAFSFTLIIELERTNGNALEDKNFSDLSSLQTTITYQPFGIWGSRCCPACTSHWVCADPVHCRTP